MDREGTAGEGPGLISEGSFPNLTPKDTVLIIITLTGTPAVWPKASPKVRNNPGRSPRASLGWRVNKMPKGEEESPTGSFESRMPSHGAPEPGGPGSETRL